MRTFIALLRGINVGGHGTLPMRELVELLENSGCTNISTYIQSGNVVLQHDTETPAKLARAISQAIEKARGFSPHILLLEPSELQQIAVQNPYPEAEADPKSLHLGCLDSSPNAPNLSKLESLKTECERFHLGEKVFYLHAPGGVGRSKLAANAEKLLGVPMTVRNWRTITKLLEMVAEVR